MIPSVMLGSEHSPVWVSLAALNDLGSQLYLSGEQTQALAVFESALKALRPFPSITTPVPPKDVVAVDNVYPKMASQHSILESPPDSYFEGECDVGPRPIRTPLHLDDAFVHDKAWLHLVILFNKALVLHSNSDLEGALDFYEECIKIVSSNHFEDSVGTKWRPELGMILHNNVGQLLYCIGNEEAAESHFAQALRWSQKSSADHDSFRLALATCMSNFGRTKWMLGSIDDDTYELCKNVLHLRSSILAEDHVDVVCARYNLGIMAYARNEKAIATAHLRAYLSAGSLTNEGCILDPIPALSYIILLENEENDDSLSYELVRAVRALQEKREDLGAENAEVASLLNYIGTLLFHRRELESSILFYREELKLEESLGSSEPGICVSVTYNNIGRILQELGQLPEAIGCYHQALKSKLGGGDGHAVTVSFGDGHLTQLDPNASDTTKSLFSSIWYNLGLIYDRMGSRSEAISAFKTSLDLRRTLLGDEHSDVACLWYNIGSLQIEQHQLGEATLALREALRIQQLIGFDEDPQHAINTMQKLSMLQQSGGDIDGALRTFQVMALVQQSSHSTRAWGITLREIANLYQAKGDLKNALRFACQSCDALRACVSVASTFSGELGAVEDLTSALLLTGSLLHESCEPVQANEVILKACEVLEEERRRYGGLSPSLVVQQDVCRTLGSCQCAPQA
jgi:tetratricopeptide (TPR) repeat protein